MFLFTRKWLGVGHDKYLYSRSHNSAFETTLVAGPPEIRLLERIDWRAGDRFGLEQLQKASSIFGLSVLTSVLHNTSEAPRKDLNEAGSK